MYTKRRERFVFKAKDGNYLDVSHLIKRPSIVPAKLLWTTLLGIFVGLYIVALIRGI